MATQPAWASRASDDPRRHRWPDRRIHCGLHRPGGYVLCSHGNAVPAASLADTELTAVLQPLPARQRQVVALRIFLDLDTAQTAEVLGIAPGTVTAHLARALAALRTEIAAYAGQGDTW
jgi:DNA-directed RNA polymerase specialized sigma24 family protein